MILIDNVNQGASIDLQMPGWYFAVKSGFPLLRRDMNLTELPESVTWPETHYVFVERIGPFPTNAPQAWQSLHQNDPRTTPEDQLITEILVPSIERT